MSGQVRYRQCLLRKGTQETTRWIETRGAKVGASVEVLPSREVWLVVEVYAHSLPEDAIKDMEREYRTGLPSTRDTRKDARRGPAGR